MSGVARYTEWKDPTGSKRLSDWVQEGSHGRYNPLKEDQEYYNKTYSGWLDHWADKGHDFRLDPNRDWKTKWVQAGYNHGGDSRSAWFYRPDLYDWHNPAQAQGWELGVHAGTGRYKHDTDRSLNYHPTIEMIDYDAYNRDAYYSSGARGLGLEGGKVSKLQDIYDIEDWYAGEMSQRWKDAEAKSQAQLDATNKQIELLQMQLDEARKPRHIDVGGYQVAEGGVADYISELQNTWDQRSASDLDALSRQLSGQFDQRYAQQEMMYGRRYDQQQGQFDQRYTQQQQMYDRALADAQAQWQSASATRDRAYDARLADLTAGWDTQRSMYDTRFSDLTSQFAQQRQDWSRQQSEWGAQRTAYDTSLANLNRSISDYQAREQKRLEQAAIESQRARTAAAYARDGGTMNPSVTGVKTQRGLTYPQRNRYGSSFKRSDMTITNKQLNI